MACATSAGSAPSPGTLVTFENALLADSGDYEPARGFRASAEPEWFRGLQPDTLPAITGTRWRLSPNCVVRLDAAPEVLAAHESAPLPTRHLGTDDCPGRSGFWQTAGNRLFVWMGLAGGWSAEYYAIGTADSAMDARRYALRRTASRTWRVERATESAVVLPRVADVVPVRARRTWEVTRALQAIGEPDWATRPGAGRARSIAGTRWRDTSGCTLIFGTRILTRATRTQRLTRLLGSVACDSLRGSWQQVGKRVFWRVNLDSLTAREQYGEVTGDSVMSARLFELSRASGAEAWQALWVPSAATTLRHVRR